MPWMASGSLSVASMVLRGCSDPYGSWNTIWHCLAKPRSMPWVRGLPNTAMVPLHSLARPAMAFSTVVLPEPLSPTSAKLSPSPTLKPMPWVMRDWP